MYNMNLKTIFYTNYKFKSVVNYQNLCRVASNRYMFILKLKFFEFINFYNCTLNFLLVTFNNPSTFHSTIVHSSALRRPI